MQTGKIERQIVLPLSKALEISLRSIRVRFTRSLLAASGIILATAFLMNVWSSGTIMTSLRGRADSDETLRRELIVQGELGEGAVSDQRSTWLVGLSLLVCVVGVANAVLMSVTERYREIGTMKCLGAMDSFVLKLFLLESIFLGGLGTILGIVVGLLLAILTKLISFGLVIFPATSWLKILGLAGLALVIGSALSVFGSLFPAYRAAQMQPIEAMRVTQ
jgi:predicted lysophospholipase L1 biosynthesis ABC-type transport system permease subunit